MRQRQVKCSAVCVAENGETRKSVAEMEQKVAETDKMWHSVCGKKRQNAEECGGE